MRSPPSSRAPHRPTAPRSHHRGHHARVTSSSPRAEKTAAGIAASGRGHPAPAASAVTPQESDGDDDDDLVAEAGSSAGAQDLLLPSDTPMEHEEECSLRAKDCLSDHDLRQQRQSRMVAGGTAGRMLSRDGKRTIMCRALEADEALRRTLWHSVRDAEFYEVLVPVIAAHVIKCEEWQRGVLCGEFLRTWWSMAVQCVMSVEYVTRGEIAREVFTTSRRAALQWCSEEEARIRMKIFRDEDQWHDQLRSDLALVELPVHMEAVDNFCAALLAEPTAMLAAVRRAVREPAPAFTPIESFFRAAVITPKTGAPAEESAPEKSSAPAAVYGQCLGRTSRRVPRPPSVTVPRCARRGDRQEQSNATTVAFGGPSSSSTSAGLFAPKSTHPVRPQSARRSLVKPERPAVPASAVICARSQSAHPHSRATHGAIADRDISSRMTPSPKFVSHAVSLSFAAQERAATAASQIGTAIDGLAHAAGDSGRSVAYRQLLRAVGNSQASDVAGGILAALRIVSLRDFVPVMRRKKRRKAQVKGNSQRKGKSAPSPSSPDAAGASSHMEHIFL